MTWSFVAFTQKNTTSGTTYTISVPAGVADGDLLVLSCAGYVAGTFGAPAGFTVQQSTAGAVSGSVHQFFAATRVASSEPASYTVTSSATSWPVIIMYAVRSSTGTGTVSISAELTNAGGYQTTLPPPALAVNGPSDITIYGYGGVNAAGSGGGGLVLPAPASLIAGSSTGDISYTGLGVDYGIIACQTASPGSATITTGVDEVNFGLDVTAATPPAALGGSSYQTFITG
jgi:hypothetical protein